MLVLVVWLLKVIDTKSTSTGFKGKPLRAAFSPVFRNTWSPTSVQGPCLTVDLPDHEDIYLAVRSWDQCSPQAYLSSVLTTVVDPK
jgi:hypothetical protein